MRTRILKDTHLHPRPCLQHHRQRGAVFRRGQCSGDGDDDDDDGGGDDGGDDGDDDGGGGGGDDGVHACLHQCMI